MRDGDITAIARWLVDAGLAGASESDLVTGFCARCTAAGLALSRGLVLIDTLLTMSSGH